MSVMEKVVGPLAIPWCTLTYRGKGGKYRTVPKFSDARKCCCNLPKIPEKRSNLWVFLQKDANGIANSEDPDQTASLGAV